MMSLTMMQGWKCFVCPVLPEHQTTQPHNACVIYDQCCSSTHTTPYTDAMYELPACTLQPVPYTPSSIDDTKARKGYVLWSLSYSHIPWRYGLIAMTVQHHGNLSGIQQYTLWHTSLQLKHVQSTSVATCGGVCYSLLYTFFATHIPLSQDFIIVYRVIHSCSLEEHKFTILLQKRKYPVNE